jgi:hypothetical protein
MSDLSERIARCLPGASFELEALVRLVGIHETTEVATAAVACSSKTRLLINPEFAAQYCARDEHLFLLVMHEMWHVLLGHTTLYARTGELENIAFDALINAGLVRQHTQPEYRGFFEELNSADCFPNLLLRPPVGWPHNPEYKVSGPRGTSDLLRRLYPPPGSVVDEPTYQEIIDLLCRDERSTAARIARAFGSSASDGSSGQQAPVLLGNHEDDTDPMSDEAFAAVVRRIVGSWPPPPEIMRGRNDGGTLTNSWVSPADTTNNVRVAFARVVKRALLPSRRGDRQSTRVQSPVMLGPGPLPNAADRMLPAKRALRGELVLPNQPGSQHQRRVDPPQRALVYLDVSGSMASILPNLVDLLAPLSARNRIVVKQFSTVIAPVSANDLATGSLRTTGGTNITCVLDDILSRPERKVLILTDGYVGEPRQDQIAALTARGVSVIAVLPCEGWAADLSSYAEIHYLPELVGGVK